MEHLICVIVSQNYGRVWTIKKGRIEKQCKSDKKEAEQEAESQPMEEVAENEENVIEILTENMDFQIADTIPSGWNTFRYKNQSTQTHFVLIDKYPEGRGSEDAEKIIGPIFDQGMKLINEGKAEEGFAEFGKLPDRSTTYCNGASTLTNGNMQFKV